MEKPFSDRCKHALITRWRTEEKHETDIWNIYEYIFGHLRFEVCSEATRAKEMNERAGDGPADESVGRTVSVAHIEIEMLSCSWTHFKWKIVTEFVFRRTCFFNVHIQPWSRSRRGKAERKSFVAVNYAIFFERFLDFTSSIHSPPIA